MSGPPGDGGAPRGAGGLLDTPRGAPYHPAAFQAGEPLGERRVDQRDGFDDRLREARARQDLGRARAGRGALPGGTWGIGLRAGVEVVSALAAGVLAGWLLDRWLGTGPWLLLLFFVLGGAAGVLNVYRLISPRRGN